MPKVDVILRGGTSIPVEGANNAYWAYSNGGSASVAQAELLIVQSNVPNKIETLASFKAAEVAGYVIGQR